MDPDILLAGLQGGNTAALARAISVVENERPGFERLLAEVHRSLGQGPPDRGLPGRRAPANPPSLSVWSPPTGRPGCESPSWPWIPPAPSPAARSSATASAWNPWRSTQGVYIRSMGSRGSIGGLGATTTREVCDLLDAAGFDRILVETVGVGQSELDVAGMADATVLVLVPESGDGIQTLKSGVMEIADLFVVNKADRPGAEKLRQEIEVTLGIRRGGCFPERSGASRPGGPGGRAVRRPVTARPPLRPGISPSSSRLPRRARGWPS